MSDKKNTSEPIKAHDENVYYSGKYWNDYGLVNNEIKKRITGSSGKEWFNYFFDLQGKRKFKKALILNCGNGWVEREIYKLGRVGSVVGVDFSHKLLEDARDKADGLPFRYYEMDINTAIFPEKDFDLIINHAAGHHIARIDKVFREIRKIMTINGLFVNYDYVGPHRNQYPIEQWTTAYDVNRALPVDCRQDMKYPHLPTMLAHDPSEAVHSELILQTSRRYFDIIEHRHAGGAIAYLLLTHNPNFKTLNSNKNAKWLKLIMKKDADFMSTHQGSSMFDFWIARPKKISPSKSELISWKEEEKSREENAAKNGGVYYENNFLQDLYLEKEDLLIKNMHLTTDLHKCIESKGKHYEFMDKAKRTAKRFIKKKKND